ncbi:unnamed protein product [Pedinophyceae sp. YPF-701]|nr:unnamed protein product [Pedinophyceae sp. YPF-701]
MRRVLGYSPLAPLTGSYSNALPLPWSTGAVRESAPLRVTVRPSSATDAAVTQSPGGRLHALPSAPTGRSALHRPFSYSLDRRHSTARRAERLYPCWVLPLQVHEAYTKGSATACKALAEAKSQWRSLSSQAHERAAQFMNTGAAHASQAEEAFFSTVKEKLLEVTAQYPTEAAVAGGMALALALPRPRHWLYKATFRRLMSQEALVQSCRARHESLAKNIELEGLEVDKLTERMKIALDEYQRGYAKVSAATSQLQSLAGRISSKDARARKLARDLRELPGPDALGLRAEVAQELAKARALQAQVQRALKPAVKQGF